MERTTQHYSAPAAVQDMKIMFEIEMLRRLMVPKLRAVIRAYEKDEVTYEEARARIRAIADEFSDWSGLEGEVN